MSYFVDQSSFVQRLEEVLNPPPPFPSSKHQSLNTVFPTLIINHCELLHSPKMNLWNKLNHFFPHESPPPNPRSLSGTETTKVLTAFAVKFVLGEQPEHQDH